ncbi:transposase [Mesorhizobium opportunistum]
MTLNAEEFIRCFLLHFLPAGFQRIRYYGLLGNHYRKKKLASCRELLGKPVAPSAASETCSGDYRDRYGTVTEMSLKQCGPQDYADSEQADYFIQLFRQLRVQIRLATRDQVFSPRGDHTCQIDESSAGRPTFDGSGRPFDSSWWHSRADCRAWGTHA